MIKHMRIAAVLLVCLLGGSSVAHAGFIDLIDQLSGPGPFLGYGGEFRIYCAGIADVPSTPTPPPSPIPKGGNWNWLSRRCLTNDLPANQRPWISIELSASYARSLQNNLMYAPGTGSDTHVSIYSFAPEFWWTPIPPLAVGSAVGVNIFRGPTFSTFSRAQITPVQIDLKPFALSKDSWYNHPWLSFITIRAGYELIPKGFDAQDFGAVPGTFHTEHESLARVQVLFDAGNWSWIR